MYQVKGDVGGNYKKMMRYALMERDEFVSQVIDEACKGLGTNETLLIDVSLPCFLLPAFVVFVLHVTADIFIFPLHFRSAT